MVTDLKGIRFAMKEKEKEVKKEKKLQDKDFLKEISPNKTLRKRKEMERGENLAVSVLISDVALERDP